ncbi:MAG: hypothetical protein IJO98_10870 [Clostridia bacterium]|nr:hypothetical protein [Clostridia bacterium]
MQKSGAAACTARPDFSGAEAAEKLFLRSGLRPENPQIFSNPKSSSCSMKIRRFSSNVSLTRKKWTPLTLGVHFRFYI